MYGRKKLLSLLSEIFNEIPQNDREILKHKEILEILGESLIK
jgi:hypothetical protein